MDGSFYPDNTALKHEIVQAADRSPAPETAADQDVSALQPLFDAIRAGRTVDLASLIVADDGGLELLREGRSCCFKFELCGIPVHVGLRTDGRFVRLSISGDLGYLPFSIEARDRRCAINAVLAATTDLKYSRIELVDRVHILLRGYRLMPRPFQLTDMFLCLAEIIHELKPFMDLLGECMDKPQTDIPVPCLAVPINPSQKFKALKQSAGTSSIRPAAIQQVQTHQAQYMAVAAE
jgi:hypothetical protein